MMRQGDLRSQVISLMVNNFMDIQIQNPLGLLTQDLNLREEASFSLSHFLVSLAIMMYNIQPGILTSISMRFYREEKMSIKMCLKIVRLMLRLI